MGAGLKKRDRNKLATKDLVLKLDKYISRWENSSFRPSEVYYPNDDFIPNGFWAQAIEKGYLVSTEGTPDQITKIHFLRLPQPATNVYFERPELPIEVELTSADCWAIHPQSKMLVTATRAADQRWVNLKVLVNVCLRSRTTRSINVKLSWMSSGLPYDPDESSVSQWNYRYAEGEIVEIKKAGLTSYRFAVVVTLSGGEWEVFVWDWKTGKLLLVSHSIFRLNVKEIHGTSGENSGSGFLTATCLFH